MYVHFVAMLEWRNTNLLRCVWANCGQHVNRDSIGHIIKVLYACMLLIHRCVFYYILCHTFNELNNTKLYLYTLSRE